MLLCKCITLDVLHIAEDPKKVAHPSGINLQLAAETGEFSQVPSLSMGVHGTLTVF